MEHPVKIYATADNIISSLGFTTQENMRNIRQYQSGIRRIDDTSLFHEPFMGARIDAPRLEQAVREHQLQDYTRMEQLFILSLREVVRQSGINPTQPDCGFIFSTTKGNIDHIGTKAADLSFMARRVTAYFGSFHEPIVISNACISGVSTLITASRFVRQGRYKHILVTGGDLLTRFVITGFQSFKSVSPERCRPYDSKRDGLSLGEACGSVLITSDSGLVKESQPIVIEGGAVTNDANHISGPSRTGDGLYYAIRQAMDETDLQPEDISFINTHGTATVYNDEMESKAVEWAGLEHTPLNSLKSYWGHTLGASGIIEAIACFEELRSDEVFGILGFEEPGVPKPVNISAEHRHVPMQRCVKTASGFGGCNGAIVFALNTHAKPVKSVLPASCHITGECSIVNNTITVNSEIRLQTDPEEEFATFIRTAYKQLATDDRKFYKMDDLCKLGYITATHLLSTSERYKTCSPLEIGLILSNRSSSLDTDEKHQQIIDEMGDKEASPAVFVYTLPNVVLGELCIRYKIQGENTFFISPDYPADFLTEYARDIMARHALQLCIIGWCELKGEQYKSHFYILEKTN